MYPVDSGYLDYQDPNFVPLFEAPTPTEEQSELLTSVCGGNAACRFDLLLINSPSFAEVTRLLISQRSQAVSDTDEGVYFRQFKTLFHMHYRCKYFKILIAKAVLETSEALIYAYR